MEANISNFSFWFALILSIGSLIFYLSGAIWNRLTREKTEDQRYDFNLGLPKIGNYENLFAISLVAAGTSLSTVFVFFLTAGSLFGWWLFLCPVLFALGNWVMFKVYMRTANNNYFAMKDTSFDVASGLVPYLGQRLTGSIKVGWLLILFSLFNLLSVLVLELIVSVEVIGYLYTHAFQATISSYGEFLLFVIFVVLLLGYVFVGGFRAVVTSDVWQIKTMKWAIVFTIVSIFIFGLRSVQAPLDWRILSKTPPFIVLAGFVINVILANLLAPLSQEVSWQRFRAFTHMNHFKIEKAIGLSILNSILLWIGLIFVAFSLQLVIAPKSNVLNSMSSVLEALRTLNDWWFPLFIFPVMTVAALSAMYSTADTCVSALLYLIEYSRITKKQHTVNKQRLPQSYYVAMSLIFIMSLAVYTFVRIWFHPTILQLIFSVFSNLVVIAPTIISTTIVQPYADGHMPKNNRTTWVMISLISGFIFYWASALAAIIHGQDFLWLSQLSILIGLAAAILPMLPVWLGKKYLVKT